MASRHHEAVSPPSFPPIVGELMLKVIERGPVIEVQRMTTRGWTTLFVRDRDGIVEAARSEAAEARKQEAKHRQRAEAFEWAAKFIEGGRGYADAEQ